MARPRRRRLPSDVGASEGGEPGGAPEPPGAADDRPPPPGRPHKGRLVDPTLALLHDAGLVFEEHDRSLVARVQNFDLDILFVRTNDIVEFVGDGVADIGVTGVDLIAEAGAELPRCATSATGAAGSLPPPADSPYQSLEDLAGVASPRHTPTSRAGSSPSAASRST